MSRIRKKKWLGIGLAVVMGLSVAASDMGIMTAFATGNKATTTTTANTTANNARFTVNGADLVVTENLNPNKYPKDFTETKVECQGRQYKGLKFSKADIKLICLLNQKTGAAAYHIYNDADQSVYPFIRIENGNDYIIAMPQSMMDGAQAPESYAETSMEFEKGTIQVYQQDGADTCLIYAMNSEGQKGWYEYQTTDKTYQAYEVQSSQEETPEDGEEQQVTDTSSESQDNSQSTQYEELKQEMKSMKTKYCMIIAVLIIIIAVLVILLINTLLKGPRNPRDEYDEEEPDEDFFDEDLDQEPEEDFFDEDTDEESDEYYFDEEPDEEPQKEYPKAPKNEPQEKPVKKKYESDIEIIDLNDL